MLPDKNLAGQKQMVQWLVKDGGASILTAGRKLAEKLAAQHGQLAIVRFLIGPASAGRMRHRSDF